MKIKSFSKNTLYYAIGIIAIRFTTFLLIPLYTHFLSKEEYGLLATLLFTTEIIITINDVGIRSALMRFFKDYQINNRLNDLMGSSIFINVVVGIFLAVISLIIPKSVLNQLFDISTSGNIILLTVLVGVVRTLSLNILSYFRAKNLGSSYMLVSIITSLILIFATWIALKIFTLGITGVLYSQIFSFGLAWIAVAVWIYIKDGLALTTKTTLLLFKFGYPLILATSGTMFVTTSGNYFLGHFRNLEEVAILALSYKIATIGIMVLIAPFQLAYEPFVFNNKNNPELKNIVTRIISYISLAYLLVSIIILFVFKYLIVLIGNGEYVNSYNFIFLLLPALGFTALNYIGQSLIHLKNKTRTTGVTSFLVTSLSIFISYFATKTYGIYGTILGINVYLILSGVLLYYLGNKEFPVQIEYKRISIISISGIFLFIALYGLSLYSNMIFYSVSFFIITIFIIGLYLSKFFYSEEKSLINKSISNILGFTKLG